MKSIGIDIGGTQLRVGIFDEDKKMIDRFKTDNDRNLTAEQNVDKLLEFIEGKGYEYSGIGIGCPGPLDAKKGKIFNPPNLAAEWDNFEIVDYVQKKTGLKTVLNNDANVAGLAEAILGAGAGLESVFFVGISTGIGGAYVYQNKLVNGANSNAAEIWNMIVSEDEYYHKGANAGALNEQASGSALERIASERFGREMKPKELFELYYEGDKTAEEIIERASDIMAKGLANISWMIDPDMIIIGGSVALFNAKFVEKIIEKAKKYILFPEKLRVEMAEFGDDAGLMGAALLV